MSAQDAARAGASVALLDIVRARWPEFAWEVTRLDTDGTASSASTRFRGAVSGGDDTDPLLNRPASLPNPDRAERAA